MLDNELIAVVAIGVVAFQGLVIAEPWATLREQATVLPLLSIDAVLYGALMPAGIGLAAGLFSLASQVSARLSSQSCHAEMCRFGSAFLPLAVFAHIGHNLDHLFNGYALWKPIGRPAGAAA